jgi:hypothetical protein
VTAKPDVVALVEALDDAAHAAGEAILGDTATWKAAKAERQAASTALLDAIRAIEAERDGLRREASVLRLVAIDLSLLVDQMLGARIGRRDAEGKASSLRATLATLAPGKP